jgi:hypothetical protein
LFDQTVVQILLEKYLLLLSTKIQVLLVLIKFILL